MARKTAKKKATKRRSTPKPIVDYDAMTKALHRSSLKRFQDYAHGLARENGWWDLPRDTGTLLMLVVSELGEAMEGFRKNKMDEHITHRSSLEVEMADAVVRLFDMAGGLDLDLAGAIVEKLEYNAKRNDVPKRDKSKSRKRF